MEELKNIGYSVLRKYPKKEIIFFYNQDLNTIIRANFYWGTYKKYNAKTKKQEPFLSYELKALCKLNERSLKEGYWREFEDVK